MAEQTMVERVARAIGKTYARQSQTWDGWLPHARAAIEAMRPDASTMGLIRKLAKKTGLNASDIDLAVCFYIDAALAEERHEASPPKA